jgi:hypothetical protein
MATDHNVFFDGSDDDVRRHLVHVFGTSAFCLVGSDIELEFPEVGTDRRPRSTGETTRVRVSPPRSWTVQAPEAGSLWHVVPDESIKTLCVIRLDSWMTPIRRDDDHAITCPWCRAMIIATEIAAPPADARPAEKVRLHQEIAEILRGHGGWMTTAEIADDVARRGRYKKQDGTSNVTAFQVHGRTRNKPQLFERDGSRVRLRD